MNDAERIAPADITLFHADWVRESVVANGLRSRLYVTSTDFNPLGRETLRAPFAAAVEALLASNGRVVVTGMGKSGHIARKVAATLASTGTPAFFLHPAEASHGDLGMVGAGDVVLAFSWSGETPELRDVINYCKRFGVQLIAVASGADSALVKAASVAFG